MEVEELLDQETKICPECAETIKLKAKKCRICGSELDPSEVQREVEARKAILSEQLVMEREGKVQCPQCGNWDVRWAMTEDGSQGNWCGNCNKSLKAMGFDVPGRPTTTPRPPETKVVIEKKSGGVWAFVGVLLAILLIIIILGALGI